MLMNGSNPPDSRGIRRGVSLEEIVGLRSREERCCSSTSVQEMEERVCEVKSLKALCRS